MLPDKCVPNMNTKKSPHSSLRYHNKHSKFRKQIAIITQIWHRAKFYFICISSPWYLIMVHCTIYEENPSNHHGGMCKDRETDGLMYCSTDLLSCMLDQGQFYFLCTYYFSLWLTYKYWSLVIAIFSKWITTTFYLQCMTFKTS